MLMLLQINKITFEKSENLETNRGEIYSLKFQCFE